MTGGPGADTFIINQRDWDDGADTDTILDFDFVGRDKIRLEYNPVAQGYRITFGDDGATLTLGEWSLNLPGVTGVDLSSAIEQFGGDG